MRLRVGEGHRLAALRRVADQPLAEREPHLPDRVASRDRRVAAAPGAAGRRRSGRPSRRRRRGASRRDRRRCRASRRGRGSGRRSQRRPRAGVRGREWRALRRRAGARRPRRPRSAARAGERTPRERLGAGAAARRERASDGASSARATRRVALEGIRAAPVRREHVVLVFEAHAEREQDLALRVHAAVHALLDAVDRAKRDRALRASWAWVIRRFSRSSRTRFGCRALLIVTCIPHGPHELGRCRFVSATREFL